MLSFVFPPADGFGGIKTKRDLQQRVVNKSARKFEEEDYEKNKIDRKYFHGQLPKDFWNRGNIFLNRVRVYINFTKN